MIFRTLLVSTLIACGCMASALAAQPYDGRWSVEVITERGSCDQAYRWDLEVANGKVAAGADMPAQASGAVSSKGAVAMDFSRGADRVSAKGSASGKWASGEWSSPSLGCSGRWRAERRA